MAMAMKIQKSETLAIFILLSQEKKEWRSPMMSVGEI